MQTNHVWLAALILVAICGPLQAQEWNRDGRRDDNRDDRRHEYRDENRDDNRDVSGTQKRACEPDVFRRCGRYIPNRDAITACLHSNMERLNPDCRAVMEGKLR